MGHLKEALKANSANYLSAIEKRLLMEGFKYEKFVCGARPGWQKSFWTENDEYYMYVHCDLKNKIVSLYKEYPCGGEVDRYQLDIPGYLIFDDDPDAFLDWLDEDTDYYFW